MKYLRAGDIVQPYADERLPPGVLASDTLVVLSGGYSASGELICRNLRTGLECPLLAGEVVLIPPRRTVEPGDRCEFRRPTKYRGHARNYMPLGELAPQEGDILVAVAKVRGERRLAIRVRVERTGREALIWASDLRRIMPDAEFVGPSAEATQRG